MRLNASKLGLLAGLLVERVVGQTTTSESSTDPTTTVSPGAFVKFGDNLNSSKIFNQTGGDVPITWTAPVESLLIVKEVYLHKREQADGDDSVIGKNDDVKSQTDNGKRSVLRIYSNAGLSARQPDSVLLPSEGAGAFYLRVDPISMSVYSTNLTIQTDPGEFSKVWNDKVLYLEVVSRNETSIARSYSPAFIVANTDDPVMIAAADGILRTQAQPSDTLEPNSKETSAPTSTADPANPTSSLDASAGESDDSSSSSANGGEGGLSPGAIAGIAVGVAVAALAIVGFLGWFFCLRRRRRQRSGAGSGSSAGFARAHEGPYGAGSGAVMMTEKEAAAAGIGAAESRDRDIHGGAAAGEGAGAGAAYTPYNNNNNNNNSHNDDGYAAPPGMAVTTTGNDSQASLPLPLHAPHYYGHSRDQSRSTATSPSPIESRYAHLVEEGMTEDEIRRLEEEERQLDAAIEEAGSTGSGGGAGQNSNNNNNNNSNNSSRQQTMSPTSPTSLTGTTPPTSPTTRGHAR